MIHETSWINGFASVQTLLPQLRVAVRVPITPFQAVSNTQTSSGTETSGNLVSLCLVDIPNRPGTYVEARESTTGVLSLMQRYISFHQSSTPTILRSLCW